MAGILERLRAEVGMPPPAILAIPAIPEGPTVPRIAESQESHGVQVATAGLERRIHAMAARWRYSADDLAEALEGAQRDPAGWVTCCLADEQYAAALERAGMPFLPEEWRHHG